MAQRILTGMVAWALLLLGMGCWGQPIFTQTQIKDDILALKSALESKHPNLYLYTPKAEMDVFFDSLVQNVPGPMSGLAFYSYITPLCSKIKDGHTVFLPSAVDLDTHNTHSRFFPFKVYYFENTLYVELNYSETDVIENGAAILSINGVPSEEILQHLLARMMRDGDNIHYPVWVLNHWFNEYYSYHYGHPDTFEISYRSLNGTIKKQKVSALTKDEIFANRTSRYPHRSFTRSFDQPEKSGITLKIDSITRLAVLKIKDFDNHILKESYHQQFKKAVKQCFSTIEETKTQFLVLDLRDNQGGDIENGRFLLSFLMSGPFRMMEAYYKVKIPTADDDAIRLKQTSGPCLGIYSPRKNAYQGSLIVLINGGSFSNSAIVSTALKWNVAALMVGEETGGNECMLGGDPKVFTLPNTQCMIEIPTIRYVMHNENSGNGIFPNSEKIPDIKALLEGRDIEMEFVNRLLFSAKQ